MKKIIVLCLSLITINISTVVYADQGVIKRGGYLSRADVQAFITDLSAKTDLQASNIEAILAQVKPQPRAVELLLKPSEGKPWHEYRNIFLREDRIKEGVKFMALHKDLLARAQSEYGVPPEIITAIIGVETFYGTRMGKFPVLDTLVTLGFDSPKRGKFFRSELEHYLQLVNEQGIEPFGIKGSYAGAMGMGQFISSSYRNYAIDFDGDNKINLWTNTADGIGSVANYFKVHGWVLGDPVIDQVQLSKSQLSNFEANTLKPSYSKAVLKKLNVDIPKSSDEALFSVIELEQVDKNEYFLAQQNFYTITRYNRSPKYAMAVYQLSKEILQASQSEQKESK